MNELTEKEIRNAKLVLDFLTALGSPGTPFQIPDRGDGVQWAGKLVEDGSEGYIVFAPIDEIEDTTVVCGKRVKANHG